MKKTYNRFLITDEKIPRRTLYRRKHMHDTSSVGVSTSSDMTESDISRISSDAAEVGGFSEPKQISSDATEIESFSEPKRISSDATEIESFSEPKRISSDGTESEGFSEPNLSDEEYSSSSDVEDSLDDSSSTSSEEDTVPSTDQRNLLDLADSFCPLYPSADISNLEAFLCVLSFIVRFNLSGVCIEELLRLLEILLPPCKLPGSKYLLNKKINSIGDFQKLFEIHFYCKKCDEYLCQLSNEQGEIYCSTCEEKTSPVEQLDNGNFFIYLPLKQQLKVKFERQGLFSEVHNHCMNYSQKNGYNEIIHGDMYPKCNMMDNISLQFNVDGMPLYQKAKYDIWPIHAMINELSPEKRRENVMMCGLWFGSQKPKMKTYLKPFVEELKVLSEKGLEWENNGKKIVTKVFPLLCTADAPARAMLQNFTQYNGKYGCGFCENKGESIAKGRGFCRIYKPLNPSPDPRTLAKTVEYAETAISTDKPVRGVKGVSLLMQLFPHFDLVQGFVPDYMHCALLGVTRQFVHLWLNSTNELYALKKKQIAELNKRISCLREPDEMTRKLRTLSEVSHWKASEWRVFLLISPVLLLNILDAKVYKHWILFAHAISLLLGSNISSQDIKDAETAIQKFTFGVGDIYGEQELSYNVHILLHLPNSVRSWGPLWATSCFSFENSLGKLKFFHKGTKGVPQQILFAYLRKTLLKSLIVETDVRNVRAETFIKDMDRGHRETKKILRVNDGILLGYGAIEELPTFEKVMFEKHINSALGNSKVRLFKRMLYKGSPADKADLEVGDEILEVNGRSLDNCTHTEVISHIHQCIRSRTICLRVKRKTSCKLALDLAKNSSVQDAFVIAVEQQARERLERLSALKKIKPVDMTKLSQELNECANSTPELNGVIENNPIYVTTVPEIHNATLERVKKDRLNNHVISSIPTSNKPICDQTMPNLNGHHQVNVDYDVHDQELELKQEIVDKEEEDDTFSPPSPRTPPHERLLIESHNERDSVTTHFSQDCVSVETLLPNLPDKLRSMPNGNHIQRTVLRKSSHSDQKSHNSSKVNKSFVKTNGIEPESRPHREMAVDVPDSFVGVAKTAPRYPPQKMVDLNDSRKEIHPEFFINSSGDSSSTENDPRIILSKSRLSNKSNFSAKDYIPKQSSVVSDFPERTAESYENATEEQLERIRKYQEDIRKRKIAEEKQALENEFLRNSLRGSKKLQALEANPPHPPKTGVSNSAFQLEEEDSSYLSTKQKDASLERTSDTKPRTPELLKTYGASELLQSLYRLSSSLQGNGHKDSDLMLVESLIRNVDFQKILIIHNKVQEVCCFKCPPTPVTTEAQDITQEVLTMLQESPSPEALELVDILSKFEMEGLIFAHDKISERQAVPTITPDEELLDRASQYTEESVKIVRIDKTNEPLGATVRNEGEAVVIGRVVKGGAAEKSGLLHEGDEILEVNGVEMRGKTVNDVCDVLATMNGTLTFLIIPTQQEQKRNPQREVVMHLKAHFDYDPDDDLYCPCRELGISFQKGDILHIINQDDPNWWQAYREGEEDQPLAGLVPSKTFQEQRESMKQAIIGESTNREKEKKGTFLCAYMQHRKKKKKLYNANEDIEDQILTYEEVALYYPRANRKRPTVLIGPPNIGRHELRQRLMEDTERFAAAVPHTSRSKRDGEVDSSDYHFITRAQFEADIAAGKFVEHGEYEKNYYGTSLDAIRAVVNSGKICVLNLHPQSLKILKNSDLLPYVVFVAPPSLEKLRMNRIKAGDNPKDDELKDIIEKAREMEENYGHYFDMVIVNSDIDKAFNELLKEINTLEREPQWVPAIWLKDLSN